MFSNRSHFSLVRNVVNSQNRNKNHFYYLFSSTSKNNCMTKELKWEYNLNLKLYLIKKMYIFFTPSLQMRSYFTRILNYPKNLSVPLISFQNRRISKKVTMLEDISNENERNQLSIVDMDFISDYLYDKAMIDFSVKLLKENVKSNSQLLLRLIKCEDEMNKTTVENILENYRFLRKKIRWEDEKEREDLGKSMEIQQFLKALQLHLSEISLKNLLAATSLIVTLRLPTDNDVALLIILRLIDELDDLHFQEQVYLFHLCKYFKETHLIKELNLGLIHNIEKQITKKLDSFSAIEVLSALKFASTNTIQWSDDVLRSLCKIALETDQRIWDYRFGFTSCYKIIHKLKDAEMDIYREKLFKKLYDYMLQSQKNNSPINLCEFAVTYALNVYVNKEPYIEEFFDHIISSIIKNKVTINDWQALLYAMDILGHIRFDVIEKLRNCFVDKPFLVYRSFYLFKNIVILIIDSVDACKWRQPWPHFEIFLENLISIKDLSFWSEEDLNVCLRVVASLASVGIFSNNVLEYLAQKIPELEGDPRICIPYLYIAINQAVTVLHPSYPKPFLTDEVLSSMRSRMGDSTLPEHLQFFNLSVRQVFESALPDKNFFLFNQKTKLGHVISVVVAVHKDEGYFNFSSINEKKKEIFIEDIILPPGYKLILVLTFTNNHYTRNMHSLRSVARIRVKTLEAMGYDVRYILHSYWKNLTLEEQINFIRFKLLNKQRSKLSKLSLEKT